MADSFSDYIVYVDESGKQSLKKICKDYPVLCIAFCIFKREAYFGEIVPAFLDLKFRYWGHDKIVLHERDLRRKRSGDYAFLNDPKVRETFFDDLDELVDESAFKVTASVIQKEDLRKRYSDSMHPYKLATLFCMERLLNWLVAEGEAGKTVPIIFENRTKGLNKDLGYEFGRIVRGSTSLPVDVRGDFSRIKFIHRFRKKRDNDMGLQVADLIARPIGLSVVRPQLTDRADTIIKHATIEKKYIEGGFKVFPK